ncbi:RluA family pseudouridine synthase [Adhaeribacter radiodurans]|uniref:RNA pseudouridine synthase n=1 Tax=Adhaeribacter radiodurans TaxID=2745197 RepID=A0A7L7L1Z9_9BACT|nr:RNA pseudouridine synthase [Adhaeribacter radiodurans]QMU26812.1 RNA pseudouridine synthase [Adhaeribacter radiodurans]
MTDFGRLVLYEDNHLIVINKPAGLLVQGDETGDVPLSELIKQYLKEKYQKTGNVFAGVVHRLDRPVSGVVLLAKTSKALTRLNELFRQNKIQKTYLAITARKPIAEQAHLVHWLTKDESRNISKAHTKEVPKSLRAELSYQIITQAQDYYLLRVKPVTGRPHQIRVQLATQKSAIVGDVKYGAPTLLPDKSICLHAYSLEFIHPIRQEKMLVRALPPENHPWALFKNMLPETS